MAFSPKKFKPKPFTPNRKKNLNPPKASKPAKPIPKIDQRDEFLKTFQTIMYSHHAWDVWKDFITMFACSLSNPFDKTHYDEREKRYLEIIRKYNKQEQVLFPKLAAHTILALEENPEQDFLGSIFTNLELGNEHNGQFFTPYDISKFMVGITLSNAEKQIEENGYISIHDPCCGAGAMLIASANFIKEQLKGTRLNYQNHVLIVGQDIDEIAALMCYIQLSLLGGSRLYKSWGFTY